MKTKSRRFLSVLLSVTMVFGLFAAMPLTASAANGTANIDVSQLNLYNANNKGNKSESQWEYDAGYDGPAGADSVQCITREHRTLHE